MKQPKKQFTIRQWLSDGAFDWAVFKKSDVKNLRGVVTDRSLKPIATGMAQREAQMLGNHLDKKRPR